MKILCYARATLSRQSICKNCIFHAGKKPRILNATYTLVSFASLREYNFVIFSIYAMCYKIERERMAYYFANGSIFISNALYDGIFVTENSPHVLKMTGERVQKFVLSEIIGYCQRILVPCVSVGEEGYIYFSKVKNISDFF